jgi:hypothetical protein
MMKSIYKYYWLFALGLVTILFSCEEGDEVFDQIVAEEQRGAILRTVNLVSNELPIGQSDGNFSVELEVQDQENGTLVNSVEVYVGFNDLTPAVGPGTNVEEQLFETVDKSTFSIGEFGLPRFTYSVTLPELLSFVGRSDSDITGGDQFPIRFELVLSDGRRFSAADNSGTLTGSYFRSPFQYNPTVICPIAEGTFSGTYLLTQLNDGPLGTTFENANVEISATGGTSRSIAVNAYPQFGGFARNFLFDLICGEIKVQDVDTGLACAAGGAPVEYTAAAITTVYDPDDDSFIEVTFDEIGGSCGATVQVSFTLTKQ